MDKEGLPDAYTKCPCLIHVVMLEAESEMKKYLDGKTLAWLYDEVYNKKLGEEAKQEMMDWFKIGKGP